MKQVIDKCSVKHHYLKSYKNQVWDLFEHFEALHIQFVPRRFNQEANALAQMGANFDPTNDWFQKKGVQLIFRPSIPNNDSFWQVFWDEAQINQFLLQQIVCHAVGEEDLEVFQEQDIIQLNNNKIPKDLIPFEGLFDRNDQVKIKGININPDNYKEYEVFLDKSLKIGISNTPKQIQEIVQLCKTYVDVISWSYDDLKVFDRSMIQYTIELIDDAKPVRQK